MSGLTYEDVLRDIFDNGTYKDDRTGVGTISKFGTQIRYDLSKGFPLITTKRVGMRLLGEELLWFLTGSTNIRPLLEKDVHIWSEWPFEHYLRAHDLEVPAFNSDEWNAQLKEYEQRVLDDDAFAEEYGDLGPVYGYQWRNWVGSDGNVIDQITMVINQLKTDPDSRRIMVSAWNPTDIPRMVLAPCHAMFQFYVVDGKLSCQLYQRSCDMFLGVPFNIASYALLTHMIAQQCDLEVGEFIWVGGDTHIYTNHFEQVQEQLSREPRPLPKLVLKRKPDSIFDYTFEDFDLVGYDPHPSIKGTVAV